MEALITSAFAEEGFMLNDAQACQFRQYYDILLDWNSRMNLTAITEFRDVVYKHFLDSALFLKAAGEIDGLSLIDVGTGAGFPGVPLKIMTPDLALCLFDSLQKRVNFLNHLTDALQLNDVKTVHGRAEDFGQNADYRQRFDLAAARAVAKLSVLSELCLPFVKVGGRFIALKGPELVNELQDAEEAICRLGGKVADVQQMTLDNGQYQRHIVVIEKVQDTPKAYPRKAGKPQKNPISGK